MISLRIYLSSWERCHRGFGAVYKRNCTMLKLAVKFYSSALMLNLHTKRKLQLYLVHRGGQERGEHTQQESFTGSQHGFVVLSIHCYVAQGSTAVILQTDKKKTGREAVTMMTLKSIKINQKNSQIEN